ncbi:MAG: TIGR03986 family CRISPR-associated RAMP protein [Bacteroidetes bacterium]|nr:TIGR03986 family CRISPR-associated RAMP protein [Bacteroidota bacterium]
MATMNEHIKKITKNKSRAPYNFVGLNGSVVKNDHPINDFGSLTGYSGFITLSIETKTPVFIRDTQISTAEPSSNFFSPGEVLRIPGSSIRGLFRNMVEMITYGNFTNFNDQQLYFRAMKAGGPLASAYKSYGISDFLGGSVVYKTQCGIMKRKGSNFEISCISKPLQILKEEARKLLNRDYKPYQILKRGNSYYCITGDISNKKNDWIIPAIETTAKVIQLKESDVNLYEQDRNRSKDHINFFDYLSSKDEVPVFFVQIGGHTILGNTVMLRVPYLNLISDHIPEILHKDVSQDFASAIFGSLESNPSRVIVEDCFSTQEIEAQSVGKAFSKALQSPKPTSYQHYLCQISSEPGSIANYQTTSRIKKGFNNPDQTEEFGLHEIRGYKQYWHKSENFEWRETNSEVRSDMCQEINPVKTGTRFKGRVFFNNLTRIELGALLTAIQLPEDCCHKIGLGKPIGLGSIRIESELFMFFDDNNVKDFYQNLTSSPIRQNETEFINNFRDFLKEQIKSKSIVHSIWENWRLSKLKKMLSFKEKPVDGRTTYLNLDDFSKINGKTDPEAAKKVLPDPEDI